MADDEVQQRLTSGEEAITSEYPVVCDGTAHSRKVHVDLQDKERYTIVRSKRHQWCFKHVWPVIKTAASVLAHFGFIILLCFVIYFKHKELTSSALQTDYKHYALASGLVTVFFYVIIVVEAALSTTYLSIRSHSPTQTAEEYIDTIIDARPLIRWRAVCYSYKREDSATKLRSYSKKRNKLVSSHDREAFHFTKYRDLTRDVRGLFQRPVSRLECSKVFIFKDEASKTKYMEEYSNFRDRNRRRDEFMEHEEEFHIPGFQEHVTAGVGGRTQPWWLREPCFWLCTSFLLTWPYRFLYRRYTTKVYVIFIKELEV